MRSKDWIRAAASCSAAVALSLTVVTAASALPAARLKASFTPDKAGQSTTIAFSFTISQPAPLKSATLRLPAGMDLATSTLGLEECSSELLNNVGPEACPPDSEIGYGTAYTVAPFTQVGWTFNINEPVTLTALYGPPEGNRWTILLFVDGAAPLGVERVLTGHLKPAKGKYGEELAVNVPEVETIEDGPLVALTHFHATIGPQGLHYTRTEDGKTIHFDPRGMTVPNECPPGGFPIEAQFEWWQEVGTVTTHTRVPCPQAQTSTRHHAPNDAAQLGASR